MLIDLLLCDLCIDVLLWLCMPLCLGCVSAPKQYMLIGFFDGCRLVGFGFGVPKKLRNIFVLEFPT